PDSNAGAASECQYRRRSPAPRLRHARPGVAPGLPHTVRTGPARDNDRRSQVRPPRTRPLEPATQHPNASPIRLDQRPVATSVNVNHQESSSLCVSWITLLATLRPSASPTLTSVGK